jgi:hypothetical protein
VRCDEDRATITQDGVPARTSHTPCALRRVAASRIRVRDAKSVSGHTVERPVPVGGRPNATRRAG